MILVFAGRPGSGKTTIVKEILASWPGWHYVAAVTTREERPSDIKGQYEYITDAEYDRRLKNNELVLPVSVHGYRSAIKRASVEAAFGAKENATIILDPASVQALMELGDGVVPVYVSAGGDEMLRTRLIERGESGDVAERKIKETSAWDKGAVESGVAFIFLENTGPLAETVSNVRVLAEKYYDQMEKGVVSSEVFAQYFSNFSGHPIQYEGESYRTAEHAYHCQRYDDEVIREEIKNAESAAKAWEISQKYKAVQKIDFDEKKLAIMEDIFRAKLDQHPDVRRALLDSGVSVITKRHDLDYYWGTGKDGTGQDWMGKLWMKLRDELQK